MLKRIRSKLFNVSQLKLSHFDNELAGVFTFESLELTTGFIKGVAKL